MRCRNSLQMIEYNVLFDQPIFSLVQRQTDLLQACFHKCGDQFPLELSNLQATGGASYADVVVAIRFPALQGGVEVRADGFYGSFNSLVSKEEADQSMLFMRSCKEAVEDVFPDLTDASAQMKINSWLFCDGGAQAVGDVLKSRQTVEFDPRAVGAEAATFAVHGQLSNAKEAWQIGFALEPSALPEYQLFIACSATYNSESDYMDMQQQSAHVLRILHGIISQFGFDEERS